MGLEQIKVELLHAWGGLDSIAGAAYVSTGASTGKTLEDKVKLIDYLAEHRHASPFGFAVLVYRLRIPIYVDRQIMTHHVAINRTVGESGRYRSIFDEVYIPEDLRDELKDIYIQSSTDAIESYKKIIANSNDTERRRVRELARGILPTGTMVERQIILSVNGLCSIMRQRLEAHAQLETRHTAGLMLECVKQCSDFKNIIEPLEARNWEL